MNFKKLGGAETRINQRQSLEIACVLCCVPSEMQVLPRC